MTGIDEAAASEYEVPAWRPNMNGPAIESVPWTRTGSDVRRAAMRVWLATAVLTVTFGWLLAVGASWIAVILLGLATAVGLLLSLVPVVMARSARSADGILASRPWRMVSVEVFAPADDEAGLFGGETRLLVDADTDHPLWLSWYPARWADQQVLARTGLIWLVGPDPDGRVLFCSAGLAISNCTADVIDEDHAPVIAVHPEQLAPARLPRARDDLVASAAVAHLRRIARAPLFAHLLAFVPVAAVSTIVLFDDDPHRAESLAGVGIVVVLLVAGLLSDMRTSLNAARIERLLGAGPWTVLPVALRPGTKLVDRAITVRLRAILADGHATSVRLRSNYQLMANVAETGQLWVAGEPESGRVVAAGLPGYPLVSLAHIGR
jgi:hypothetical protein